MYKHEEKHCPRCSLVFECKAGSIMQCQCFGISFNEEEKQLVEKEYTDCLCRNCLLEMKKEITVLLKQLPLQKNG